MCSQNQRRSISAFYSTLPTDRIISIGWSLHQPDYFCYFCWRCAGVSRNIQEYPWFAVLFLISGNPFFNILLGGDSSKEQDLLAGSWLVPGEVGVRAGSEDAASQCLTAAVLRAGAQLGHSWLPGPAALGSTSTFSQEISTSGSQVAGKHSHWNWDQSWIL